MSDQIIAKIRTGVPVVVGAFLTWLATRTGFVVDDQSSQTLILGLTSVVTVVYYALVKWAEQRWPQFGWLLGVAKAPTYDTELDQARTERLTQHVIDGLD